MLKPKVVSIVVALTIIFGLIVSPNNVVHAGSCRSSYNYEVVRQQADGQRVHVSFNNVYAVAVANLNRQPSDPFFATHVYDDCGALVAGGGVAAVDPATGQPAVVTQQVFDEATKIAELEARIVALEAQSAEHSTQIQDLQTNDTYQQGQIDGLTAIFQPDGVVVGEGGIPGVVNASNSRLTNGNLGVVIDIALVLFGLAAVVAIGFGIRHLIHRRPAGHRRPQAQPAAVVYDGPDDDDPLADVDFDQLDLDDFPAPDDPQPHARQRQNGAAAPVQPVVIDQDPD